MHSEQGGRAKTPYLPSLPPTVPLRLTQSKPASGDDLLYASATHRQLDEKADQILSSASPRSTHPSSMWPRPGVKSVNPPKSVTDSPRSNQSKSTNQWTIQWNERRRMIRAANARMQSVTGRRNDTTVKVAPNTRSIYLTKVGSDYTDEDILQLMKSNGVSAHHIRQINGKHSFSVKKSFLIVISDNDFDKTMDENFWPFGLECREWLTAEKLRELSRDDTNETNLVQNKETTRD